MFFLQAPLRAGLISPTLFIVHLKISFCATLVDKDSKEGKGRANSFEDRRLEDGRKD